MPRARVITALIAVVAASAALTVGCSGAPDASVPPSLSPSAGAEAAAPQVFDKSRLSIDDPASIWVVTDKLRPLSPIDFVPPDLVDTPVAHVNSPALRSEAADAVVGMFAAGAAEGAGAMQLQSAYRSYAVQDRGYNGYVASLGQAQADRQSARPGHSEHQTGLAIDVSPVPATCVIEECFGTTPQGAWLAANSWRFGFILRYPADKVEVTGFMYEPWHFRYVGVELATEMHDTGVSTLEEFFGLPAAPDYAG